MNLIFVSNYYNHHQSAVSKAFFELTNQNYLFIATSEMPSFRKELGYNNGQLPKFVLQANSLEKEDEAKKLILEADVVIYGSAPYKFIKDRIKEKKITFAYSERIYKKKWQLSEIPLRFLKYLFCGATKNNHYLLCASAYAYADYQKTFCFTNRAFNWGYFPVVKKYDNVEKLIENKDPTSILWVARLIEWKHPDDSILVAEKLKKAGYHFKLNLIGNGVMETEIAEMIKNKNLEDCVSMLGAMSPEKVRIHMEKSQIFLFTSDFNEGWGAVLNESMNSGCAVVASHAIGSVPFLINDGENGLIYKNGDIDDLYNKVKFLLDNPERCKVMGKYAYKKLADDWNAEVATQRFMNLAESLLNDKRVDELYFSGPCSKAKKLKNMWYKNEKNN